MRKKLIVLDHNSTNTYILPFDTNVWNVTEDYFDIQDYFDFINEEFDLNLKDSECSYMEVEEANVICL